MIDSPADDQAITQRRLRSDGVLVTLGTLIAIEVLTRTVFRVPTPGAILLLPVAYAAFTGGLRTGLISATLMVLYALHFFAAPGQVLQYTDSNFQTIIVLALIAVAMVGMMGRLKQRIGRLSRHNQLILQAAGEGICGLDAQGMITFLNPAAATMCGWRGAELIGQPIHTLLRPPLPNETRGTVAQALDDSVWPDPTVTAVAEGVFWRKDGTAFPVEYLNSPIWDHHTLIGAVITFQDITERKRAEGVQHFLIEASTLLGSSLDYATTLTQVAQLSVPYLADWCAIHMLAADGTIQRLAVVHTNPTKAAMAHERPRQYPLDLNAPHFVPQVVRTGQSELIAEVSDAVLIAAARDADHLQTLRTLGFTSSMCVPLVVRERTLGAITFASTTAGRRYIAADLAVAEEVAHRAALAIDNAELYHAAQEQREWLHVTLSSIGDAVIATDTMGHVTFMNLVAGALTGWSQADAIGRDVNEILTLISTTTRTPTESPIAQIVREDGVVDRTNYSLLIARDGTERLIEAQGTAIRSGTETILGVVLVFHDITERQQAEAALREREASFRLLFANNPLPMWVYDLQTLAFLEVNQAAVAHYGYARSDFLAMHISDIRPSEDIPLLLEQINQPRSTLAVSGPWRHQLRNGSLITVMIYSHTLDFADHRAALVVAENITERKHAEDALRDLNADLERRVGERTAQLEATNKELESFSYSVSHDLRAPLRSIDGFSQALLEDYGDQLDTHGQDYLQRVRAATQRMAQLIDDLLSLARVTRSELHYDRVDLSGLAATIAEELQRTQPERQVTFVIAPGLVAHGDARLLQLVLENLIGNAWKFTAKQVCPRIEFGVVPCDDQLAYFVRDTGAGFDMAYADKLFGAFQRLHAMTEFAGTGIGLATVQRIIHRHGGRIWAESAVDQGATFFFTLQQEVSDSWVPM